MKPTSAAREGTPEGVAESRIASRPERITVPVAGMHCAACANRIERNLQKTPGMRKANVNFATGRATGVYDPGQTGVSDAVRVIRETGYDARVARTHIGIQGLAMAAGIERIEKLLRAAPGVLSASANLASEEAYVEYVPGITRIADLHQAIREAGYEPAEAIKKLMGLQAKTARVVRDGRELDIPMEEVVIGDVVVVRPGEKLPVDGVVVEGESAVGAAMAFSSISVVLNSLRLRAFSPSAG